MKLGLVFINISEKSLSNFVNTTPLETFNGIWNKTKRRYKSHLEIYFASYGYLFMIIYLHLLIYSFNYFTILDYDSLQFLALMWAWIILSWILLQFYDSISFLIQIDIVLSYSKEELLLDSPYYSTKTLSETFKPVHSSSSISN